MSNYLVPPINPNHEVRVGWDPPLNTYFAHVIDTTKDEDDLDRDVLWSGYMPNQIHDLEEIKIAVKPYANIPEVILHNMYGEAHA